MPRTFRACLCIGLAVLACASLERNVARAAGFNAKMFTVAGSGAIGYRDGDALSATFTLPMGIALGPNGSVYVSDAGAQRIRVISNGRVRTIAGGGDFVRGGFWVRGGYQDGPGLNARFNFPAALAVDSKGDVFVADADNRCIREIDAAGTVSTFSGSPDKALPTDGPRASATFHRPLGVALNSQGDLYVADQGVGIRKIAADGTVSTLLPDEGVSGVSVSPDGRTVLASNLTGGLTPVYDGHSAALGNADTLLAAEGSHLGDLSGVGHPFASTMIDTYRTIYTDGKTGAIRYVDLYLGATKFLAGDRGSDASNEAAGFRDGPLETARVSNPLGLAVTQSGTLYFADAGNRRVRSIATLNFRQATNTSIDALPPQIASDGSDNIVAIGNSYIWANCVWDDSWEGLLEARLRAAGKRVSIYPVMMVSGTDAVMFDYMRNVVAELPGVRRVIFLSNVGDVISSGTDWRASYVSGLRQVRDALAKNGIALTVAVEPTAYDFDWQELPVIRYLTGDSSWYFRSGNAAPAAHAGFLDISIPAGDSVSSVYADLLNATRESGVNFADLTPYFLNDLRKEVREPLYGSSEWHQSDHGRAVMADAMFHAMVPAPAK